MWFNESLRRWVLWSPGSDAPPVPGAWAPDEAADKPGAEPADKAGAEPADAMSRRPPMRSPYRLVPIVIGLLIVAAAVYQASRPPAKASRQDIAAAVALRGRCLARTGGTESAPRFSATPVTCTSRDAAVKVLSVFSPSKGDETGHCPSSGLVALVVYPTLRGEPFECLVPVPRR